MRIGLAIFAAITGGMGMAIPPTSFSGLESSIRRGDYGKIVAVEAEQHRSKVFAANFALKAGELHDIRSAGKSLTALAVGLAIEDGKLTSVNERVWPLLGSAPDDPHNQITVRDLLTMSSALDCDDTKPSSPGQEERMYRTRVWRSFAMTIPLDPSYRRDNRGFGRFSYCTAGVFLLGQVVEKATGEHFDEYVGRRILSPLGITAVQWRRSSSGEIQSGGQLRIGAADLVRIGRMVLDHGRWQGQQIVPESWVRQMLTPYRTPDLASRYGYLWWLFIVPTPAGPQPSWMMSGNGGNFVAIFRDYDAVIVVQSANYNQRQGGERSFDIVRQVVGLLPVPTH